MFAYVILHYQNLEMTCKCVENILQLSSTSSIVIVDNCSPNKSGELLQDMYQGEKRIIVLINHKNEGFAKGNNIGYSYARTVLKPDVIAVINNDVIIQQNDFESIISEFINRNDVDVCGPDIITPKGTHQNPLARNNLTSIQIIKSVICNKIKLCSFSIPYLYNCYVKHLDGRVAKLKSELCDSCFNIVLHGSCLIYGSRYVQNEIFAFPPITFMYGEEWILQDYLNFKKYRSGLCAEAQVIHIGGQSTIGKDKAKLIQRHQFMNKSFISQLRRRYEYFKMSDNS